MNNDDSTIGTPFRGIVFGLLLSIPLWAGIISIWYWVFN